MTDEMKLRKRAILCYETYIVGQRNLDVYTFMIYLTMSAA